MSLVSITFEQTARSLDWVEVGTFVGVGIAGLGLLIQGLIFWRQHLRRTVSLYCFVKNFNRDSDTLVKLFFMNGGDVPLILVDVEIALRTKHRIGGSKCYVGLDLDYAYAGNTHLIKPNSDLAIEVSSRFPVPLNLVDHTRRELDIQGYTFYAHDVDLILHVVHSDEKKLLRFERIGWIECNSAGKITVLHTINPNAKEVIHLDTWTRLQGALNVEPQKRLPV